MFLFFPLSNVCSLLALRSKQTPRYKISTCSLVTVAKQLEIWGRAQREATQRRKFDWGVNSRGEIYLVAKSRGPKSNAVAYAERAMSTWGVSTSASATCLLVDQNSPIFLVQRGRDGSRSSLLSIFGTPYPLQIYSRSNFEAAQNRAEF